jgi:transposase-like protein
MKFKGRGREPAPGGSGRRIIRPHAHTHPFEIRRKAVQLCLEESFPVKQVAREMGLGLSTLSKWVRMYREQRGASLQAQPGWRGSLQIPAKSGTIHNPDETGDF